MAKRMGSLAVVPALVLLMAAATGGWIKRVPEADRAMANPVAGHADAIEAGGKLFQKNCAMCHGADGNGKGSRPAVHSARIAGTTDGQLFWLLKNGIPQHGMPAWTKLPEDERWQIVAYLRSIQPGSAEPATK